MTVSDEGRRWLKSDRPMVFGRTTPELRDAPELAHLRSSQEAILRDRGTVRACPPPPACLLMKQTIAVGEDAVVTRRTRMGSFMNEAASRYYADSTLKLSFTARSRSPTVSTYARLCTPQLCLLVDCLVSLLLLCCLRSLRIKVFQVHELILALFNLYTISVVSHRRRRSFTFQVYFATPSIQLQLFPIEELHDKRTPLFRKTTPLRSPL